MTCMVFLLKNGDGHTTNGVMKNEVVPAIIQRMTLQWKNNDTATQNKMIKEIFYGYVYNVCREYPVE